MNSASVGARPTIGVFVSPHGFGHASRTHAILERMLEIEPILQIELFTRIPKWFFSSLSDNIDFHELDCDLGLVQSDALRVNYDATLADLSDRLPFDPTEVRRLGQQLRRLDCQSVLCDIAPLGLVAARAAQLPSVLVENFTWDWIYEGLALQAPALSNYARLLRPIFQNADLHIQTQPICEVVATARQIGPIARAFRRSVKETRATLGLKQSNPMVFISMGGTKTHFPFTEQLKSRFPGIHFVISGASNKVRKDQNVTLLPVRCPLHHPDLVRAADLVIGKAGYSTIAEVYASGTPFGYFVREDYPEMAPLGAFAEQTIGGKPLAPDHFANGLWLDQLPELLALKRQPAPDAAAAVRCAELIWASF
ncbi:MAG: hypothetical protein HN428_10865 [Proteobacteria bacterium]|nr:hypothetical protein [Pseudomonadota bacterium]MBT5818372.1 hypothetical protein [Pseudomonadota bacterium]MBT6349618.1 hypothetical protein [Pseudomonadota bacterium]